MTALQSRIVALLRRRVSIPGQIVAASCAELAERLGDGLTTRDVQAALAGLVTEEFFLGRPHLSSQEFMGRLPS